ncbi:MAG: carbohydrate ABC transporter permease [Psychrilyobacter sp.]|nr:carbohydrate ABC transporter permease [Psychrilyobacter sp.]
MKKSNKLGITIVLIIFVLIWILPILYAVSTSFKSELAALSWPIKLIPEKFTLEGYLTPLRNPSAPVLVWFWNSFLIATIHTVLAVSFFTMAGYSFARLKFKFRDQIFAILLATMMVPGIMNLVPLYLVVRNLGLVDTKWAMILPGLSGIFNVFLMRQFFLKVPKSLEESAIIDGASPIQIFFKIMLPLVKPGLLVVAIFSFIGNWNDFLWPSIVTNDVYQRTLPVGLAMMKGNYGGRFNMQLALVIISFVPVVILFSITQKYIMRGLSGSSGIKE